MRSRLVLAAICLVAALYLGLRFDRGWIRHDEGYLAHSAERTLAGEWPHRDFTENYTGGLTFFHALAFHALGIDLRSPRLVLLAFSLVFVPAVYFLARRVAPPLSAAAVTLTALVWSLPNYFAALPSWYNLFFATFGAGSLFRFIETSRKRWLFVAGLLAGLSIAFKTTGLFFVAAVLLFLVYWEAATSGERGRGRSLAFSACIFLGLGVFGLALGWLVSRRPTVMDAVLFLLPSLVLSVFLVHQEWRHGRGSFGERGRRLAGWGGVFLGGVLVPVTILLLPYAVNGALGDLYRGVFVLAQRRFSDAAMGLPPAPSLIAALPLAWLLAYPLWRGALRGERIYALLAALSGAILVSYSIAAPVYRSFWFAARPLVPLAALVGCALLARRREIPLERRGQLFVLLAMAALVSLVQFPYSFGIYFCYTAPLVLLAVFFLVRLTPEAPRKLHAVVLAAFFFFGLIWLNLGRVQTMGGGFTTEVQATPLSLERGGLRISEPMAALYSHVVGLVQSLSEPGEFIYAAPDSPEIYFLSARRNPTGTFYDFFDDDFNAPEEREKRILALLEERGVDVVVLNWRAEFSGSPSRGFAAEIERRYPQRRDFQVFTVYWR